MTNKSRLAKALLEAEEKYLSIAKKQDAFNPNKPDLNMFDDEDTNPQNVDKDALTKQAIDKITQSLEVSDELQSILNQIKKLNTDEDAGNWKINEEGNTAILKNKNARIFKQNAKLCLSMDGKVKIFDSVAELHAWLKSNNLPLPKNIKLHEGTEYTSDVHPWQQFQFIISNVGSGSWLFKKAHEIYNSFEHEEIDELKAKELLGNLVSQLQEVMWGKAESADLTEEDDEEIPTNRRNLGLNIKPSSPWYKILNTKTTSAGDKIGDTRPFTQEDLYNAKMQNTKKPGKMGRDAYKYATQFMNPNKKDPDEEIIRDFPFADSVNWYLSYEDANKDENLYLNSEWEEGNLLTNNISQAATFMSRDEAMNILDAIYAIHDTEAPLKPIQLDNMNECFGGVTTAGLGAAVQYTGDKKEESLTEEQDIKEVRGYPGTPFENVSYAKPLDMAKEYLKWLSTKDKNGKYGLQLDPKAAEHEELAKAAFNREMMINAVHDSWMKLFKKYLDPKTGKALNKKEFHDYVTKVVNPTHGLDINPDEDVLSKKFKQDPNFPERTAADYAKRSDHNEAQYKAYDQWFRNNKYSTIKNPSWLEPLNAAKSEIETNKNLTDLDAIIKHFDDMLENDFATDTQVVEELMGYKNTLSPKEFNALIDKTMEAIKNAELNLSDGVGAVLPVLKVKTEACFKDEFSKILDNDSKDITLTEDDKPEDFATNLNNQASAQPETTPDASPEAPETTNDGPDIDLAAEPNIDSPAASFGDINIGDMGGDYSPEEDNVEMPAVDLPDYKIVDILVNEQDDSDIKIKVQNIETGEIETKTLDEIDI